MNIRLAPVPDPLSTGLFVLMLCLSSARRPSQAALKKYQVEHKSKGESLEKCQAELKKLRRKSQGSKNPSKYGEKEIQVSHGSHSQSSHGGRGLFPRIRSLRDTEE